MKMQFLAGALLATTLASHSWSQQAHTVAAVDLDRYVGKWYEIARFPNSFQSDCAGNVTAEYVKRDDGDIDVINRCKTAGGATDEAVGRAKVEDPASNARLKVRFAPAWLSWLPFVWADYWVVDLAPDYSLAAVGGPDRDYLWLLSRTPELPEAVYEALVNRVTAKGYDTSKLVKTTQESASK
jgi:apolipoprotein D and lipocalin family protein